MGSVSSKVESILRATATHASNLGMFVGLFKTGMAILSGAHGGYASLHPLFAGMVAGYAVFGRSTPINRQIVLYLFARVALGLVKHVYAVATDDAPAPPQAFPVFAASAPASSPPTQAGTAAHNACTPQQTHGSPLPPLPPPSPPSPPSPSLSLAEEGVQ